MSRRGNQSRQMISGVKERGVGGDGNVAPERIVRLVSTKVGRDMNGDGVARDSSTRKVQSLVSRRKD